MTHTYKCLAIKTTYWRPHTNYTKKIIENIKGKIKNGDIVTISEKAVSTASGNIIDESKVNPTLLSHLIAKYWMRYSWGYPISIVCHLRKNTIKRLRFYPINEGATHKQVTLEHAGLWQTLMHGSEGAIDGSNLPYSYVSLPLKNAQHIAQRIQEQIANELHKNVAVMILDTDKTYSFRNFHFTPRPNPINGIHAANGLPAYLTGRFLKLKQRATPIALVGNEIGVEEALVIADLANRARGFGAGRNVWDMAETFNVAITDVTWDMLDRVEHKPIVILRRVKASQSNKAKIRILSR